MIKSLIKCSQMAEIFVYAFDELSYEVLIEEQLERVNVISFEAVVNEKVLKIQQTRSRAEFCWTMTPVIIEHSIKNWKLDNCTYIDADLYFFEDPVCLINEMISAKSSVLVTEHRFKNNLKYRRVIKRSGRFCVEFNSFLSNDKGMSVLEDWKRRCLECCTSDWNTGTFGDQKYLDDWEKNFGNIHIMNNHGGGMAPWNIENYVLNDKKLDTNSIRFHDRRTRIEYDLIFYHFHGLGFLEENKIDINIYNRARNIDDELVRRIYDIYCKRLYDVRCYLKQKYQWNATMIAKQPLLWKRRDSLSVYNKLAKIVYLPKTVYDQVFKKPKDYVIL